MEVWAFFLVELKGSTSLAVNCSSLSPFGYFEDNKLDFKKNLQKNHQVLLCEELMVFSSLSFGTVSTKQIR